ncbi:hypothetical protein AGMMS50268_38080 [Spirochaetia bacterium]|nr:hypothetical protein AGMMS50268_38080 [Spirochaetia bacterium]
MKIVQKAMAVMTAAVIMALIGCASGPKVTINEMENKGSSMGVPTPDWIKNYTANGITAVQAQPQFKDTNIYKSISP